MHIIFLARPTWTNNKSPDILGRHLGANCLIKSASKKPNMWSCWFHTS